MPEEILKPIALTPEMTKSLEEMGPNLATLDREIKKAERIGLDVKDMKEKFIELTKMRQGLLKEYT